MVDYLEVRALALLNLVELILALSDLVVIEFQAFCEVACFCLASVGLVLLWLLLDCFLLRCLAV